MLATTACALLTLAGCGWRPLYERPSPDPTSGGVGSEMASISIDPISTRTTPDPLTGSDQALYDSRAAQLLHNYLRDGLNPYGPPSSAAYHLSVELTHVVHSAISLGNGQPTREDLKLEARYELIDEKGTTILTDASDVVTSYDVLTEPFSDLTARNDALKRGTEQLALAIRTRLAVFFKK